jgi:DNA-binding MarR family transcriptional regulator
VLHKLLRKLARMATKNTRVGSISPAFGFLPDLLGYHLRRAQIAVFQDFAASVDGAEITPGQFGVLALIDANSGLSQTQLGTILGIDRSTVVGVIDKLEARGLVERADRPDDRRTHALRLSPNGQTRFRELARRVRSHETRVAKRLSVEERKLLIDLLQRIVPAP